MLIIYIWKAIQFNYVNHSRYFWVQGHSITALLNIRYWRYCELHARSLIQGHSFKVLLSSRSLNYGFVKCTVLKVLWTSCKVTHSRSLVKVLLSSRSLNHGLLNVRYLRYCELHARSHCQCRASLRHSLYLEVVRINLVWCGIHLNFCFMYLLKGFLML